VTSAVPRLLSLATVVPPHALGQPEVTLRARHLFAQGAGADFERLMPVFAHAGIERRYSSVPIEWYESGHGWAERNALYLEHAVSLLNQAARDALTLADLKPEAIDAVVVVSTTGVATPALDARLMAKLPLRSDVKRLPIFGLGCAGGVVGLARAADMATALPGKAVLCLVVELCTLSFRRDDLAKSNIVATALFGDGAAAALLRCDGEAEGPAIIGTGEHTWPNSLDIMGWDVADDGLKAIFSRDIPRLMQAELEPAVDDFLARQELRLGDIDRFVCHPGGPKVLDAFEAVFGLEPGALEEARGVLRDYGNMSAASVLFVLERMLARSRAADEAWGRALMIALGPGFTAGFALLGDR
jgi:alkylresorcinol/alkylpyrone synthase